MAEATACPACGALNLVGQRFCGTCGSAISVASADPAPGEGPTTHETASEPTDERRWVTVVFADIAGFTSMSEQLDFEEVRDIADRCAEVMGEEIRRFGGTVLNVMGDAVMAVFGAPAAHDDDPERAVRASLAMVAAIPKATPPQYRLALHVGVNTGEVMAGLLGPSGRRDYTVMGDTINTGARLEAAAVRGQVLVGRETYLATRHAIRYETQEPVTAKGKTDSLRTWLAVEPLRIREERSSVSSPLVGRDRELRLLQELWKGALEQPKAQLVTVIGAPGLGKSRLGREFAALAEQEGARVLTGRSLPFAEGTGYGPFADQLRAAAGLTLDMGPDEVADRITAHVTELLRGEQPEVVSNLLAMLGLSGDTPVPEKSVLFSSARRWISALARHQPTLLLFEDMHWADATLVELIRSVASRAGEIPLLVLCTARPELLEQQPDWAAGQTGFTAITLDPLSEDASRQLSAALLSDRPPEVVDRLVRASGGNPLFLEELSATITEQNGAGNQELPTTVKAIIGARLDLLSERERSLLQHAAVIGDVFWKGAVVALGGGRDVSDVIDLLETRGLIRREDNSALPGEEQFIFKHALIREVAYSRLPRRSRRERHAVIASYLEEAVGQREEMARSLAHHWDQAGDSLAAIHHYRVAGDRASKAWAKKEAIDLYARAIELSNGVLDPEGVADLKFRRGRAFTAIGDSIRAAEDLDQAIPALTGVERARALLARGRAAFIAVDADGMVRFANEATLAAQPLKDRLIEASALSVQASASLSSGRLDEAIERGTRSVDAWPPAQRAGDADYADSLSNLALYHYWRGDYQRAIDLGRQAVDRALAVQAVQSGAQGTAHLALALVGLGRHSEAIPWFERSVGLGLDWEAIPRFSSRSMNMWAGSERELMNFKRGRELSERALEMARRAQFAPAIHSAEIDLFLLDVNDGRLGEAQAALSRLWQAANETKGFHNWLFQIRVAEAEASLALARGKPEEGIEPATLAVTKASELPRKKYQAQASTTLARCLLGEGLIADASKEAARALSGSQALGHPHSVWRAADALSQAEAALGDDRAAEEAAHLARERIRHFGATLDAERAEVFFDSPEVKRLLGP